MDQILAELPAERRLNPNQADYISRSEAKPDSNPLSGHGTNHERDAGGASTGLRRMAMDCIRDLERGGFAVTW